jgi:hypothetical protein
MGFLVRVPFMCSLRLVLCDWRPNAGPPVAGCIPFLWGYQSVAGRGFICGFPFDVTVVGPELRGSECWVPCCGPCSGSFLTGGLGGLVTALLLLAVDRSRVGTRPLQVGALYVGPLLVVAVVGPYLRGSYWWFPFCGPCSWSFVTGDLVLALLLLAVDRSRVGTGQL